MADSNKSVNVITKGSVTVNVNNKTVEKDGTQKKESAKNSFANESATSSKSSQSQKVDTGSDRFSEKDVSDFSKYCILQLAKFLFYYLNLHFHVIH